MWSHVAPTRPCLLALEGAFLGLFALWWAKFGWPKATTMRRFKPRSHSTLFFRMEPLTNDGALGAIPLFPKSAPYGGSPPLST